MPISNRTSKTIWGQFAGRCAICREPLVYQTEAKNTSLIGEVAHIVGEQPGSARSNSMLTQTDRNSSDNLLLVCRKHHKIIDDQPGEYSVERLREIRSDHIDWVNASLTQPLPWRSPLATLFYINVPRLGEYALTKGYDITPSRVQNTENLSDLGFELVRVMHQYKDALAKLPFETIHLREVKLVTDELVGSLIHFERQSFRTKNISHEARGQTTVFTGDRSKDPHIYTRIADWDVVVQIDQRWITTTTAQTYFRPSSGTVSLSGFARVTHVDMETKTVIASPFALGLPPSVFDQDNQDDGGSDETSTLDTKTNAPPDDEYFSKLEDSESIKLGETWSGGLHACDFCGRLFEFEDYMVDGPMKPQGPWGNMCSRCYRVTELPLGMGNGQLYRKVNGIWQLIAGGGT